jgi:hypothetical protein
MYEMELHSCGDNEAYMLWVLVILSIANFIDLNISIERNAHLAI